MIQFGTWAEKKALDKLLKSNHRVAIIIQLMDLSHNHLSEISDYLLAGQVNMDTSADVTRSASMDLRDPNHRLKLDDAAPSDGSLFFTRMVKIVFVISTPDNATHYPVPIFTGPLTKVSRSGPIVTIEAQGKEVLAFQNIWQGRTLKKGMRKTDAIAKLMQLAGESAAKMHIIDRDNKLGSNISANVNQGFWKLCRHLARGMNLQLFYDGRGVLRVRRIPSKVVYQFEDDGAIMTLPQVSYEMNDSFFNCIKIVGGKPKGKKKKVQYKLVASKRHPLSPWNMGRNGNPRYIPYVVEDDTIKSKKHARLLAKRLLNQALNESVSVAFDSLPVPYLEEHDLCRFRTRTSSGAFHMQQMSIPLTVDGTSSIGYLKNTTPRHRGGRHRRKGGRAA